MLPKLESHFRGPDWSACLKIRVILAPNVCLMQCNCRSSQGGQSAKALLLIGANST